jgi:hypothetical protein
MPKEKIQLPAWLPKWKNEPLKFTFSPDAALHRGAFVKLPKGRGQTVRSKKLARI